jgi:hypothetical protein
VARHVAIALLLACAAACAQPPPAPDYSLPKAWAAWPGRAGPADAVPQGLSEEPLPDAQRVDVFFIHPTTFFSLTTPNARFDEPGVTAAQIDRGVLRYQASVFNAWCRIYAPHYRQAALSAFTRASDAKAQSAFALAYADVLAAFDYYVAHENHGRPFVIAAHSQGSLHALRLLQERIAGKPLQQQLVAAYVVGYYVPRDIERLGIAVCAAPQQTGCVASWNTVSAGAGGGAREKNHLIWLEGRYQHTPGHTIACVNPLNWREDAEAPPDLNLGALPASGGVGPLPALVPQLTGARCDGAALHIDIPAGNRSGFKDLLTFFGSYHIYDYNIFYANIRANVRQRVLAYRAAHAD